METRSVRAYTLIFVIVFMLCQLSSYAQKHITLPFDYSDWKIREGSLSHPDLLRVLPFLRNSSKTICIACYYEEENEHFALGCVSDVTYGEGPEIGCLVMYEHKSTFIYDYGVPFATYEFDYEVPVLILNAIYHDMKENCISRRAIVSSLGQFIRHRLYKNKWGPGDGYYESPEYTHLVFKDTQLLERFRHEFPFMLGLSVPDLTTMLHEYAVDSGYSMESRKDIKELLITLYQILSASDGILN